MSPVPWNDPSLRVKSDPSRRAAYRALQSWWRETELQLPPGRDKQGVVRGNLLPTEAIRSDPKLNFLSPEVGEYVAARAPIVSADGGTLELDRLQRNLLSSMPLCFNLFGKLRAWPQSGARALSAATGLDIAVIEQIEVEWTPDGPHPLGDRTAFDAMVLYRTGDGRRAFLGVETKYTEPFSGKRYTSERYDQWTTWPGAGFRAGAAEHLAAPVSNQLWRNCLLAVAVAHNEQIDGHVMVVALADDPHVPKALAPFVEVHADPADLVRAVSLETLMAACSAQPLLRAWARAFSRRYLDLSPVR